MFSAVRDIACVVLAYSGRFARPRQGISGQGRRPSPEWMPRMLLMLPAAFVLISVLPAPLAAASHFQLPFAPTEYGDNYCDYLGLIHIRGMAAQAGDEVAFVNGRGEICGTVAVNEMGQYGTVPVYGHNTANGDHLSVRVWDGRQGREWQGGNIRMTPGTPRSFFVAASVPPIWEKGAGFVLNIEVLSPAGDVNGDGIVDLADLVLTLQILAGGGAGNIAPAADVNGDGRIGLAEAEYVLQSASGLR